MDASWTVCLDALTDDEVQELRDLSLEGVDLRLHVGHVF